MMEFLAANFNLPTIIVAAIVFGCVGWITWHSHKHGGGCGGCSGDCGTATAAVTEETAGRGSKSKSARALFRKIKVSFG